MAHTLTQASPPNAQAVQRALGGLPPLRIVTTGYRSGGALAQAAAIWAATAYPQAQIRCIVFGAPQVPASPVVLGATS